MGYIRPKFRIGANRHWSRCNRVLYSRGQTPINVNLQSTDKLNFDELAYTTLFNLKSNLENFDVYQVNNNFFEPLLYNGDYIGGISYSNLEMLTNKLCYIFQNKMLLVGIFNYTEMSVANIFKQTIKITDTTEIGAVSWIAKRQ